MKETKVYCDCCKEQITAGTVIHSAKDIVNTGGHVNILQQLFPEKFNKPHITETNELCPLCKKKIETAMIKAIVEVFEGAKENDGR